MSKKIRNATICCLSTAILLGSSLVLADTTTPKDNTEMPASNATLSVAPEASVETAPAEESSDYNPVNKKTETVYVSLDSYGAVTKTQVVNGYHLNGASTITDYGNYSKITNLTNFAEPVVEEDKITWKLDGKDTNFYYQGDIEPMELPWNISVRYKLNGVETKVEELAGAVGMIETIIDLKPNDNVSNYLKNNFFLQISTSYDMGKNLSVEAQDGIIVSLGDTKSVSYMTLPGEEATYHIYVGSNNFESTGFNFVMAPLNASVLDEVGNLKDAKERLQGAGDAVYDSINTIIDSTSDIKNGLSSFADGLKSMQSSINAIEAEGNANDEAIDKLNEEAKKLNESLSAMTPHLTTAQDFVNDTYAATNEIVNSINDLKDNLTEIQDYTQTFQDDLAALKTSVNKIASSSNGVASSLKDINSHVDKIHTDLSYLNNSLTSCGFSMKSAASELNYLKNMLGSSESLPLDDATLYILGTFINSSSDILSDAGEVLSDAGQFAFDAGDNIDRITSLNNTLANLSSAVSSSAGSATDTMDHLSDMTQTASDMIDQLKVIIDNANNVQATLNKYQPELISSLKDMKNFMNSSSDTLSAATDLTDKVHTSIKNTKGDAYDSLRASIDGAIATINETIKALNTNDDLKENTTIIHDTINNEWDRIDDEYNLLDFDKDALPVSLISDKNTDIDSIQIVLSTPEITVDKQAEEEFMYAEEEELSVWQRILNIFNNMF